jgi:hypothetical protein
LTTLFGVEIIYCGIEERDLEENDRGLMEIISRNLLGDSEETHEKPVRIACVPAEMSTEPMQN